MVNICQVFDGQRADERPENMGGARGGAGGSCPPLPLPLPPAAPMSNLKIVECS